MPQYLIIHDVLDYPESQDDWIEMWRSLRERACAPVEWLHSFYEPSTRKMYCEWNAPDIEAIMACLSEDLLSIAPVISSSEVVLFDVAWLDEGNG
jgi:hypothetical protein